MKKINSRTMPYFAYGSNMVPSQMAFHCPAAEALGVAVLYGYRFIINADGYATIVPDRDSLVLGVVWEIDGECERGLDRYEGIEEGLYRKARCKVELPVGSGEGIECLTYIGTNDRPGRPVTGYMEPILETAAELGFPEPYLAMMADYAL